MFHRKSRDEILSQILINGFLLFILLVVFFPMWRVFIMSVTPLEIYGKEGVPMFLSPAQWSFAAYKQLMAQPSFTRATLNSIVITLTGTAINLVLTVPLAYALSTRNLPGRGVVISLILFTFLFHVSLVPVYLLITKMGMVNNILAVIMPGAVSVYNTLVMKSFFEGLPEELKDAARIDGANDWDVLWRVVLPLSKPIILTIGLFYAVAHWNEFFAPILYFNDNKLMPLPVLLRNILIAASFNEYVEYNAFSTTPLDAIKAAGVLLTMLPMLIVYPWIQRYFTKGTLLGGVKE